MHFSNTSHSTEEDQVPQFTCNDEIVVLNTTLVSYNCFALVEPKVKANKCDEACSCLRARRPYHDEFLIMNITKLKVFDS